MEVLFNLDLDIHNETVEIAFRHLSHKFEEKNGPGNIKKDINVSAR